jgi:hypothetical protein
VGVPSRRRRRLQVQSVECVGPKIGDEHVGLGQEVFEARPVIVQPEIEDHAALAPVVEGKGGVREVAGDPERAEDVAHRVACRRFDLDDIGAPIGQQCRCRRCCHPYPQLENPEIAKRREAVRSGNGHADVPEQASGKRRRRDSLCTLPLAVIGSSSTTSTKRGAL